MFLYTFDTVIMFIKQNKQSIPCNVFSVQFELSPVDK